VKSYVLLFAFSLFAAASAAGAAEGEVIAGLAGSAHLFVSSGTAGVEEFFDAPADGTRDVRTIRLHPAPGGGRMESVAVHGAEGWAAVRSVREDGGDWVVELAEPLSVRTGYSIAYRAEGFSWRAHYELARGMRGRVELASPLGRALPDAKIRLAGVDSLPAPPARGGRLSLREETPLNAGCFCAYRDRTEGAAAWEALVAGNLGEAGGEIPFWDAAVGGVENEYRFPATWTSRLSAGRSVGAERVVRLPNDERNGSDGVLPAGDVLLGGAEKGWTDWTPPGGTMEIVLDGAAEDVTLEKRAREPDEALPEGRRRIRLSWVLRNQSPAAAKVELHLVPATPFPWEMESVPPELESVREGDEIVARGVIPAGKEWTLRYALVCSVPQALRLFE